MCKGGRGTKSLLRRGLLISLLNSCVLTPEPAKLHRYCKIFLQSIGEHLVPDAYTASLFGGHSSVYLMYTIYLLRERKNYGTKE